MKKFKLFGVAVILSTLMAAPVFAHGSGVRPQAYGIGGRQVAAPPWSAACMTDQGPSECGEPMWVYGAGGGYAGTKNALSPEAHAPHRYGRERTHDDWPANMILG